MPSSHLAHSTARGRRRSAATALLVLLTALAGLTSLPGSAATARAAVAASAPAVGPGGYVALPPTRIYDSRTQSSDDDKTQYPRVRSVRVLGRAGVPASGVAAVVVNVTAANPGGPGYLSVYAAGSTPPATSNLNWARYGAVAAGLVVARVGSNGMITIAQNTDDGQTRIILDLAGYLVQPVGGAAAGQIVPVAPSRVLDTRRALGVPGTAPVGGGGTVHLQVAGRGGVPASGAGAVLLNVTVTGPAAPGYLTAFPDGTTRPLASNLNYATGQTVPNLVLARLSAGGKVALTVSSTTHVVADVAGWVPSGSATAAGSVTAVAPSRILDTRDGTGATARGPLAAGTTLHLQVAGRGGVPVTGAGSVVLNLTTTGPMAGGYLSAAPDDGTAPGTSNVNYEKGQTLPNLVVVKLSADGRVAITTSATTHVVADVAGWVSPGWGLDSYLRYDGPWSGTVPGDQLSDTRGLVTDPPPSLVTPDTSSDAVPARWNGTDCDPDGRCVAVGTTVEFTGRVLSAIRDPGATAWAVTVMSGARVLTGVRCPGAGHCYASGAGSGADATPVFDLDEATSTWTPQLVPVDRSLVGASVDCGAPGSCAVVATRDDSSREAWAISLRDGAWTVASEALPSTDGHPPLLTVRCPGIDLCAVFGSSSGSSSWQRGIVFAVRAGVPGSLTVQPDWPGPQSNIEDVDCWSSTGCLAVGWQNAQTQTSLVQPLALSLSGDTWVPVTVPLPWGMEQGSLRSVDCTSADRCVVGGDTAPRYPTYEGKSALVLTGGPGTLRVLEVPATHVQQHNTSIGSVRCAQTGRCYLGGMMWSFDNATDQLFVLHEGLD